jgi:hypothetical protein
MAVDTRNKRASVLGIATAIALTLPLADGAVGQGDRQHVAFSYAGITAQQAVVSGPIALIGSVHGAVRLLGSRHSALPLSGSLAGAIPLIGSNN